MSVPIFPLSGHFASMNFVLPDLHLSNNCIQFIDKKKNIIIEGEFAKILYSAHHFTMNGVFLRCNIVIHPPGLRGCIRSAKPGTDLAAKHIDEFICKWERTKMATPYIDAMGYANAHLTATHPVAIDRCKTMVYNFDPQLEENLPVIIQLCEIEEQIINYYKQFFGVAKTSVFNLKSYMLNGVIKIHEQDDEGKLGSGLGTGLGSGLGAGSGAGSGLGSGPDRNYLFNEYLLKISGVWETKMNVGLTFKFVFIGPPRAYV